jgi:diacylglycerol kinase (ATP)
VDDGTTVDNGTDRGVHELVTHQLNIANGNHHAGRAIARDTGVDDRQPAMYRLGDPTGPPHPRHRAPDRHRAPPLPAGPAVPDRPPRLADPPMDLDVDGEIRGRTPAQTTLEANPLRVMVGADFPDARGSPVRSDDPGAAAAGPRDRARQNARVPGAAG